MVDDDGEGGVVMEQKTPLGNHDELNDQAIIAGAALTILLVLSVLSVVMVFTGMLGA